jgi:hypothetical protein
MRVYSRVNLWVLLFIVCPILVIGQTANGVVVIRDQGVGNNYQEALGMALTNGLTQSFGAYITSETIIEGDDVVKDEISRLTQGNILDYEVISERVVGNEVYLDVEIRVSKEQSVDFMNKVEEASGKSISFDADKWSLNVKQKQKSDSVERELIRALESSLESKFEGVVDFSMDASEVNYQGIQAIVTIQCRAKTNHNITSLSTYIVKSLEEIALTSQEKKSRDALGLNSHSIAMIANGRRFDLFFRTTEVSRLMDVIKSRLLQEFADFRILDGADSHIAETSKRIEVPFSMVSYTTPMLGLSSDSFFGSLGVLHFPKSGQEVAKAQHSIELGLGAENLDLSILTVKYDEKEAAKSSALNKKVLRGVSVRNKAAPLKLNVGFRSARVTFEELPFHMLTSSSWFPEDPHPFFGEYDYGSQEYPFRYSQALLCEQITMGLQKGRWGLDVGIGLLKDVALAESDQWSGPATSSFTSHSASAYFDVMPKSSRVSLNLVGTAHFYSFFGLVDPTYTNQVSFVGDEGTALTGQRWLQSIGGVELGYNLNPLLDIKLGVSQPFDGPIQPNFSLHVLSSFLVGRQ